MRPTPEQIESVRLVVDTTRGERVDFRALRGGGEGPVEVEIGCGKGEFLMASALRHPRTFFVGVEVARKYALKSAARLVKAGATNARVAWMDGMTFLERAVPPASLRAVHVYFPDPWPKRRHHRRRVVSPRFTAAAARALRRGGNLYFLSDDAEIYAHVVRAVDRCAVFAPQPYDPEAPSRPETGFERKWRAEQRVIRGARWMRLGR
jgi:tRNA (guanine-N7-)-methyltransferase